MEIKNIKLTKGMKKEEVNELVLEWVELLDDIFLGVEYKHNWKCKCGENFIRTWDKIRYYESIRCLSCSNKRKRYKKKILICECCGRFLHKEALQVSNLCNKHYNQFKKYGKFLDNNPIGKYDFNEIIIYEDYAEIILRDYHCNEVGRSLIDLEDVEKIKNIKWYKHSNNYVSTKSKIMLHRFIMGLGRTEEDNRIVDHINRNKLDNRKCNLRISDKTGNNRNVGLQKNNKSGITGVRWDKQTNKWKAEITVNYKNIYLGIFDSKEDAIKRRLIAEKKYFGEYAPQQHLFNEYDIK